MENLLEFIKKHKVEVICGAVVAVALIVVLVMVLVSSGVAKVVTVEREEYSLKYDDGWKVTKETGDEIVLKRGNEAEIAIQITPLSEQYKFLAMEDLIGELRQGIQAQNEGYKLLSEASGQLTEGQYDGYKLLYEDGDEQVMVAMYKKGGKLVTVQYAAENAYFDILLDSVNSVIYSLDVKDEKFSFGEELKLELGEVEYSEDGEVDEKLGEMKEYEIASDNYLVKYTLPAVFRQTSLDSKLEFYDFKMDGGRMSVMVDVKAWNIYEYLDEFEDDGVLAKVGGEYDEYVYKNQEGSDETVELVFALGNTRTLSIKIESAGLSITKKMVEEIKIESVKNYASFVRVEKENGKLIGELKKFAGMDYETVDVVTLRVPEKYVELDKGRNIYEDRYYGWNYDEEMDFYEFEVHYGLSKLSAEDIVQIINDVYVKSTYGEAKKLAYVGNLTLDGKTFRHYVGGYTDISGIMFTSTNRKLYYVNKDVLIYEIPEKGILYIEVDGNGKEVTKDVLSELVDFVIKEEKI